MSFLVRAQRRYFLRDGQLWFNGMGGGAIPLYLGAIQGPRVLEDAVQCKLAPQLSNVE